MNHLAALKRWRAALRARLARLSVTKLTILQLALTVTASYSIAHFGLGHTAPALACTVALSSLSLNRDARPARVAETAIAMVLGITLSAAVVVVVGRGAAQILVTLLVVLSLATLASKNPAFALSAGTQSMLVAVLPDPEGGPFIRALDGSIGGLVALIATAALPSAPLTRALRVGDELLRAVSEATHLLAQALADGQSDSATLALTRLRALDPRMQGWRTSLESARSVASFSPLSRRDRTAWIERLRIHDGVLSAVAGLRMLARRVAVITRTGRPQPRTALVVSAIAIGIDSLVLEHSGRDRSVAGDEFARARTLLEEVSDDATVDHGIVAMLRPILVDCLTAAGESGASARASLPPVLIPTPTSPVILPRRAGN
ncbi:FUSC family protein [Microbacteriaceae bacterium VKM Ac-2854]|nr:FUSC family protein [Microbacteriaceae bacterium VKM Ac-2854]